MRIASISALVLLAACGEPAGLYFSVTDADGAAIAPGEGISVYTDYADVPTGLGIVGTNEAATKLPYELTLTCAGVACRFSVDGEADVGSATTIAFKGNNTSANGGIRVTRIVPKAAGELTLSAVMKDEDGETLKEWTAHYKIVKPESIAVACGFFAVPGEVPQPMPACTAHMARPTGAGQSLNLNLSAVASAAGASDIRFTPTWSVNGNGRHCAPHAGCDVEINEATHIHVEARWDDVKSSVDYDID